MRIRTEYLYALDNKTREKYISQVVQALKNVEFDSIAFSGVSGALVAPIVAQKLGKGLILVRKGERNHSAYSVEGHYLYTKQRIVILDDFAHRGHTIRRIVRQIKSFIDNPEFVAVCFYGDPYRRNEEYWEKKLKMKVIVSKRKGRK